MPTEIGLIATGYKEASDFLVDHLAQVHRDDALLFPIIFGYRQYLELRIKALTSIVNRFDEADEEFRRTHNLGKLWSQIRPRLLEEITEEERETFQIVENCIMEFHEMDPKSDTFRFPGELKQHVIDLGNMKTVMNRVAWFLDSLSDYWEAEVDTKF